MRPQAQIELVKWPSEGWEIEGFLVLPAEGKPPFPILVHLHGGPERQAEATKEYLTSACAGPAALQLAAEGFAIFLPNPRGSAGRDQAFEEQIGDYHLYDRPCADVLAGLNHLIARDLADPDALGIYGFSYGAELAVWTVAHSDNFRCAAGVCGRYDQEMLARYSGQPFHTLTPSRLGSASPDEVWGRPKLWQLLSPAAHADKIKVPILLLQTSAEDRPGQTVEPFFNQLREQGVETYLFCYSGAFHGGQWSVGDQEDYLRRLVAWFEHCLLGKPLPDWFRSSPGGRRKERR